MAPKSQRRIEEEEERLLNQRIAEHKIESNTALFLSTGIVTVLLPTYLYITVLGFDVMDPIHLILLLIFPAAAAYCLSRAYKIMFESEYHKRIAGTHVDRAKKALAGVHALRVQTALAYTLFFTNVVFMIVMLLLQLYVLRRTDLRANFILAFTLSGGFVWLLTSKNEESRKRRKLH